MNRGRHCQKREPEFARILLCKNIVRNCGGSKIYIVLSIEISTEQTVSAIFPHRRFHLPLQWTAKDTPEVLRQAILFRQHYKPSLLPSSSSLSLTPEMRYPTTYFTPYDKQHQFIRIIVPLNSPLTPTKCVMIPVLDLGSGVIFSALLQFGIRIQIQQKEEPKQ